MTEKPKPTKTISLRLPIELIAQLERMAKESGTKFNPLARAIFEKVITDKNFVVRVPPKE